MGHGTRERRFQDSLLDRVLIDCQGLGISIFETSRFHHSIEGEHSRLPSFLYRLLRYSPIEAFEGLSLQLEPFGLVPEDPRAFGFDIAQGAFQATGQCAANVLA